MMSDLPGEITKQILSAPPRIIRSTRYSLTAQGRSTPPSRRLPTGRSSFEKARGWMRLPRPAAGTMPHMSHSHGFRPRLPVRGPYRLDRCFEIARAAGRGVLGKDALARVRGDAVQLGVAEVERRHRILARSTDEDVTAWLEEGVEPFPAI